MEVGDKPPFNKMIEEFQQYIDKIVNDQNCQGISDFEGYSPNEMQFILHDTFVAGSPIQLAKLSDLDYQAIPILNQIRFMGNLINKQGELRLTNRGYLPTRVVSEIYSQGFLKDDFIESGISKLYKETDSLTVRLSRILLELSGIAKKRNNKLSLTGKGEKIISDNDKLLRSIFITFGAKFNWAYFDAFDEDNIGQFGYGFSLILLSKYGKDKRLDTFYADKYFKAYPQLINKSLTPRFGTVEHYASRCYSLRTFDRFLDYFGLIKIEQDKEWDADKYISKTEIYDKLIKCTPPGNA